MTVCAVADCPLPAVHDGLCQPHATREARRLTEGGARYPR